MVYAVVGTLYFSSAAKRDSALGQIRANTTGRNRWNASEESSLPYHDPSRPADFGLTLNVRFISKADADAIWAQTGGGNDANILPGSFMQRHDCPHDGDAGTCTPEATRAW